MLEDFTYQITEFDKMLLMEKDSDEYRNWRFEGFGIGTAANRAAVTLAIVRHVIEDFMGWTPEEAYNHFSAKTARMFRLNEKVLIGKQPPIPSYGFINFTKPDKVNWHYLVFLCYPNNRTIKRKFSYAREAVVHYRQTRIVKDINRNGGTDASLSRLSKEIVSNISVLDEREVYDEFFRLFVSEYVVPDIAQRHLRTNKGVLFDLYRYFYENERSVQSFLAVASLKPIFKPAYPNGFDMAASLMPALGMGEDPLWRDVFAYNRAAGLKKTLDRVAQWRKADFEANQK